MLLKDHGVIKKKPNPNNATLKKSAAAFFVQLFTRTNAFSRCHASFVLLRGRLAG